MIGGNVSGGVLGDAMVWTSNNRGHTPEEIAEMSIKRFVHFNKKWLPILGLGARVTHM